MMDKLLQQSAFGCWLESTNPCGTNQTEEKFWSSGRIVLGEMPVRETVGPVTKLVDTEDFE